MMPTLAHMLALAAAAAIGCAVLILLLRPFLARYAMAPPNARSSHVTPTPQGGGIAVIGVTMAVVAAAMTFEPEFFGAARELAIVLAAALGLAIVGVTDDVQPMAAFPRLVLQAIAVAVVLATLPPTLRIIPDMPWLIERALLLVGGVWFVNLVNFMDGIDWITVAEMVPITFALAAFGFAGALPPEATIVAIVLCGTLVGFAPFNRPVAQLFLGDVGSLPIGLLVGWLLLELAGSGDLAAAVLLPLYYLADATITVFRRLLRGEPLTQAHRSHFYQQAVDRGRGIGRVLGEVFAANVLLALLAALALRTTATSQIVLLAAGTGLVAVLLWDLSRKPRSA